MDTNYPKNPMRKSVSWNTATSDPAMSATGRAEEDFKPFHKKRKSSLHAVALDSPTPSKERIVIPVISRVTNKSSTPWVKKSKASRSRAGAGKRTSSTSWFIKLAPCCADYFSGTSSVSSSENDDILDLIRNSEGTAIDEEEIIARLEQAVHDLGQRPTSHEIDLEILKYQKALEVEQKLYEESGQPKFKYKLFRKNKYLAIRKHPIYGTNYENQRKLETRLKEFRFGATTKHRRRFEMDSDIQYDRSFLKEGAGFGFERERGFWTNDNEALLASIALLCNASNFLRFARACYANGGFTFILTYILMVALVGQPLLFFEMLIGQYSYNGPMGFSKLHPYAMGIPYAIAFVCIVFGTSKSIYLAYCFLYFILSIFFNPGDCDWWRTEITKCLPYTKLEESEKLLREERANGISLDGSTDNITVFSVELYFREVIQDSDWESKGHYSVLHWKLAIAYIFICIIAYLPIHYNFTGKRLKRYLMATLTLPILVFILFLHQVFSRGAIKMAPSYFVNVDSDHVSVLPAWSECFEMVLSTLGIGYGFHWAISARSRFDYYDTYRISWHICGFSILIGLISSLVIFCEVALVGEITGIVNHYHVFFERLGISFVCFSGALIKFAGFNTKVTVALFFGVFVVFGMWSQILVGDVFLQWFEYGHILTGKSAYSEKRKKTSILLLFVIELAMISPYLFGEGSSVLASENIFDGSLAAYTVVVAELVVTVFLYGFTEFAADVEIMTKRRLPVLFHIQIRYIVIPTTLIFLISMLINVYIHPSIYKEREDLGWLFYFGLLANFTPILIIVFFTQWKYFSGTTKRKVHPEPFRYDRPLHQVNFEPVMKPILESRFVGKASCPSQTYGYPIRSEIYNNVEHNMRYIYDAQQIVHQQFRDLLRFKRNQNKWLLAFLKVMAKIRMKTMPGLIRYIMLYQKHNNNKIDQRFIKQLLNQLLNLIFYAAVRKLQKMPAHELLPFLADEMIFLTKFPTEEFHYHYGASLDSSSSSDSDKNDSSSSSSSSSVGMKLNKNYDYREMHRIVYGRLPKTPEELRTLLTIRLKKGLGLPYDGELNLLKFLRRDRAKKERELSCWSMNDKMPIDHFIPASISKEGEKVCQTIFHAVVVEGNHHFVLKKLPCPRPAIVRVTKAFVAAQPGETLMDKFSQIVKRRLHKDVTQIVKKKDIRTLPKDDIRKLLWKVSDRVDDDVYDFLDKHLTCIVVIVDGKKEDPKPGKQFLLPPTRRKIPEYLVIEKLKASRPEFEVTTYSELTGKMRTVKSLMKLLKAPADIIYHPNDSSSEEDLKNRNLTDNEILDVASSSGSSSSLSSTESISNLDKVEMQTIAPVNNEPGPSTRFSVSDDADPDSANRYYAIVPTARKSMYLLKKETVQHRHQRQLQELKNKQIGVNTDQDQDIFDFTGKRIKHISAKRWSYKRRRSVNQPGLFYTEKEKLLHEVVDVEAERRAYRTLPRLSQSMEDLRDEVETRPDEVKRRTVSFDNLHIFLDSDLRSQRSLVTSPNSSKTGSQLSLKPLDYLQEYLNNRDPNLHYMPLGRTLIVDNAKTLDPRKYAPASQIEINTTN